MRSTDLRLGLTALGLASSWGLGCDDAEDPSDEATVSTTRNGDESTATSSTTGTTGTSSTSTESGDTTGGETTTAASEGTGESEGSGFANVGVCGVRSRGIVTVDSYDAYEEFYLIGDEGFGEDLCVIRFDVTRVGAGPEGCSQSAGQQDECVWAHLVAYRNPSVLLDLNGACAQSELGLDEDAIALQDGQQIGYGYVVEYQGHNSVLLTHDAADGSWTPFVNAGWAEASGALQFDWRSGFCRY